MHTKLSQLSGSPAACGTISPGVRNGCAQYPKSDGLPAWIALSAGQSSCAGTVTLWRFNAVTVGATGHQPRKRKTAVLTVARGSFRAVRGRVTTVKLHLSPQARTLLARTHMLHVRATIVVRDPNGATHTIQVAVTLRLAAGTRRGGRG